MLVLTRKNQERIRIGDDIVVTVLRIKGNTVRVGVEAPREIRVLRGELPPKEDVALEPMVTLAGEETEESDRGDSPSSESTASSDEQPAEPDILRRMVRQRRQAMPVAHAV